MYAPLLRAQDTTRARVDTAAIRRAALRDSIARDSAQRATARRDIIAAARAADSIKAAIAPFAAPPLADIGRTYRWNRDELFATGALTLNDLLVRVPGIVTFTSGWLAAPQIAGIGGEFRTVRVFIDGFEYDEINPRAGRVRDLSLTPLWTLDEVRIEATGREVRVHLTTWSVRSTTASTRVDVATGDYDTNTYRGYYGKRFGSGAMLQFGAYQYSTQDNQLGDADHLALMARGGWAKGRFSIVGTYYTLGLDRTEQLRLAVVPPRPNMPAQDSRYTQAHARIAYGDPTQNGFWAQLGAGSFEFRLTRGDSIVVRQVTGQTVPETTIVKRDTTRIRPQYLGALGYTTGPFRLSATARTHEVSRKMYLATAARASAEYARFVASVHAEQRTLDSTMTVDGTVRLTPLPFLALSGTVGRTSPISSADRPTTLGARAELGVRLGRVWLTGGALMRDTASLAAPVVFDTAFQAASEGRLTGTFATIRGKFLGDLGLDVLGVRWDTEGFYRPQYQTRSQLYIDTQWRSKVPSGSLNILAAVTHEYRGRTFFPVAAPGIPEASDVYRTWGFLIEVRILRAVLTYQFRNIQGFPYEQVPGYLMPRQTNYYGIRWSFVN